MTSYALHVEVCAGDGRRASVWAIAPSPGGALALIEAYRDESGFAKDEFIQDAPIEMDGLPAEMDGIPLGQGTSTLFCLFKRDVAEGAVAKL